MVHFVMDWFYRDLNPLAPPTPRKDKRHDFHARPLFPVVYKRTTQRDKETSTASPYFHVVYKRRARSPDNEESASKISRVSTVGDGDCIAVLDRLQQSELMPAFNATWRVTRKRSMARARKLTPIASGDDCSHLLRTPKKTRESHIRQKNKGSFKSISNMLRKKGVVRLLRSVEQECEVSLNKCCSLVKPFVPQEVVPYVDPTNDSLHEHMKHMKRSRNREKGVGGDSLLEYMKHRKRTGKQLKVIGKADYALKPHGGGSMIVPHGHLSITIKKQRSPQAKAKAKVDLDQETKRVWNLLIRENCHDEGGGVDMEQEKWWEKERHVFRGRADAFIARMHHIQGNRRFSKWNGSVVDSVVGAFLTQNVSDKLSSSAFMTLAATFPLSSSGNCKETNADKTKASKEQGDGSIPALADTVKGQEKMPIPEEQPNRIKSSSRTNMVKPVTKKMFDRKALQKEAFADGANKERSNETMDSVDWESVRNADVNEISEAIRERGMENKLARRIKLFLDSLVQDHGSIDIEWLKNVPPEKAKKYLLSFEGMGIKSVECVRLLTLHQSAFPVDTNVGRVCVRLGWVPLQPLPESLQLHLLKQYPLIQKIQAYLWPRLCTLDQRTLYELHYQLITFGKVFCTKAKPNCNACPMRGECKHFASAFASSRLQLEGPEEKRSTTIRIPSTLEKERDHDFRLVPRSQLKGGQPENRSININVEPIIEEPATPEHESTQCLGGDMEDAFYENPDKIPVINLSSREFGKNILKNYMQENRFEIQDGDISKALVAITENAASIPMPKLKNVNRLRTWHHVYELPDSHPLLEGMDKRWPDDPCPYLLAIWSAGETSESIGPPQSCCISLGSTELCESETCFGCNSVREAQTQTIRGTILIPCRTAMKGSFPLNGTYFQVNEVFADHMTSHKPIDVPRKLIWNLDRCTVAFGISVATIFQGLTLDEIRLSFCRDTGHEYETSKGHVSW